MSTAAGILDASDSESENGGNDADNDADNCVNDNTSNQPSPLFDYFRLKPPSLVAAAMEYPTRENHLALFRHMTDYTARKHFKSHTITSSSYLDVVVTTLPGSRQA